MFKDSKCLSDLSPVVFIFRKLFILIGYQTILDTSQKEREKVEKKIVRNDTNSFLLVIFLLV